MKKLIEKDKKIRKNIQIFEKKKLIFKSINYNANFFNLVKWKSSNFLNSLPSKSSITFVSNRCVYTVNKKKINKLTNFSRVVFLKLVKSRNVSNIFKSSW